MFRPNKNIKIFINYILGPLLALWLFYSLYKQVRAQPNLRESINLMLDAPTGSQAWKFWSVIILAFLNWGIEAVKWQTLMYNLQRLKFFTAFKAVLSGVTFSLNTPNRIGEYGGRILYVEDGKRIKAISLCIAGSMSQLIVTLFMGSVGLFYLIMKTEVHQTVMGLSLFWLKTLLNASLITTSLLALLFFRLSWLIRMIEKIPTIGKAAQYISVLDDFTPKILLRLLTLSTFRFFVFVIQYNLLLQVMHVELDWWQGASTVSVLFLVLAIIPSFALADLGIRGKFSTELFGLYSINTLGIIGATFGIWFINLFVPALIGSLLILGIKIFKDR
ncbi:MAG: lysylphosphatidylglycerol synthase domain-containing protein [Chitinophagaceae bacterium]